MARARAAARGAPLVFVAQPSTLPTPSGGFWAASVAGTLAYQWRKPIPTNLKIIHARVVAQAACLAGLAAIATVEYFDHKAELKTVAARLEAVEAHVGRGKE